jgi:hypothetical protein
MDVVERAAIIKKNESEKGQEGLRKRKSVKMKG